MSNNETINQKMIEEVYEVKKETASTIVLSGGAEDNQDYEYEESEIFLNESDATDYSNQETDTQDIKQDYESDLYVDEVIIERADVNTNKISIDKLDQHDLEMILLKNKNLEVKEITITKKVLVEKSKDTSVEAQDHSSMSVNQ
tara:strand:- start:170 stop:601 length:432 start_codon:yes stop_codon:yes gene_type:complete